MVDIDFSKITKKVLETQAEQKYIDWTGEL